MALTLAGCGNRGESTAHIAAASQSASADAAAKVTAKEQAQERAEQRAEEKAAHQRAIYKFCWIQVHPLETKLSGLRSKLSLVAWDPRGLTLEDYMKGLDSVNAAYNRMIRKLKAEGSSDECMTHVALRLESAMNAYIDGYNKWLDCARDDDSCGYWGSEPKRKNRATWARADSLVTAAESALSARQR